MFRGLSDLFVFTSNERKGILILIVLILMVIAGGAIYKSYIHTQEYDYSDIENELAGLKASQDTIASKTYSDPKTVLSNADLSSRYEIDPNSASLSDFMQLGLTEKQSQIIVNYRNKGGLFNKKEDLKKIYSIDEKLYQQISNYITIPDKSQERNVESVESPGYVNKSSEYSYFPVLKTKSIDLNAADSTGLKLLRGIGSYYSARIVKFRESLGGYHSLAQLHEVYGLDKKPELVDSISKYLFVQEGGFRRININKCTIDELKSHPYIRWSVANSLVRYREVHGDFENLSDIMQSDLVDEELYSKIAVYLKLDDNN